MSKFSRTVREAVKFFLRNGYTSREELERWQGIIRQAAESETHDDYISRVSDKLRSTYEMQINGNQLPSVALDAKMISTPTYLFRCRGIYDHHDMAAAGNWNFALPEAQRLGMRQGIFQQLRSALLYGMNPAGGEGLLNTAGATTESLPPDSNSNTTVLTYDHGQMAVYLLGHVQAALTRTMQLGRQQRVVTGVEISVVNGNEIRVWDNDYANHPDQGSKTSATDRSKNPVQINFNDLIGQPTWISFGVVSVICVMRADLQTGDHILMPEKARPMIQASSYSQFRDDSAFNGEFVVQSVRLLGNSRQPTAEAWITVIEAYPAEAVKTK